MGALMRIGEAEVTFEDAICFVAVVLLLIAGIWVAYGFGISTLEDL